MSILADSFEKEEQRRIEAMDRTIEMEAESEEEE